MAFPFRIYVVKTVGGTNPRTDPRRAKYFRTALDGTGLIGVVDAATVPAVIYYGQEPWAAVGARLSPADDALVAGQSDCFALPYDLESTLDAAAVATVQQKLEAINMPGGWVTVGMRWIDVVKPICAFCTYLQRFTGYQGPFVLFAGGVTLDTTFAQLSATVRTNLTLAAQSFGLQTSGVTGSTTIRQAMGIVAPQLAAQPVTFGDVVL